MDFSSYKIKTICFQCYFIYLQILLVAESGFRVFWNAPYDLCQKFGVRFRLDQYGIIANHRNSLNGRRINIFYEPQLGTYPRILPNGTLENGGVPQVVNLSQHLNKSRHDIHERIPWRYYDGLSVIDWESWRPIWARNWGVKRFYKNISEEIVLHQHPDWPSAKVVRDAKRQFQKAAKQLMQSTLDTAQSLRPGGAWGFYGFPYCQKAASRERRLKCDASSIRFNNELRWLFRKSDALFPYIYLNSGWSRREKKQHVMRQLVEANRIVQLLPNDLPIYAYARFDYKKPPTKFYSRGDLASTLRASKEYGIAGIVLWGSSNYLSKRYCKAFQLYLKTKLGPYIKELISEPTRFSQQSNRYQQTSCPCDNAKRRSNKFRKNRRPATEKPRTNRKRKNSQSENSELNSSRDPKRPPDSVSKLKPIKPIPSVQIASIRRKERPYFNWKF